MKKKDLINLIVGLVVLAVAAGIFWKMRGNQSEYSVVYLTTGEVYVGHLSTFPALTLKGAYLLQLAKDEKDPTKTNFQLNPVSQALWAPKSLRLVEKNVVFYGPLTPESQIAKSIAAQGK